MPPLRVRQLASVLVAGLVALSGCVTPALGESDYRGKGHNAVGSALSEVATAQLVVEQVLADRLPRPYADETVSAAEDAIGSISNSFGAVQPPRESDPVQGDVSSVLDEAGSALTDARIAVRRGDTGAMTDLVDQLRKLADKLRALQKSLA